MTLHLSTDGNSYNIGQGNRLIDNIAFDNQEEGFDITAGTNTWVEGNETYSNGRAATIAHTAQDVVFVRNYSHNEPGVLVHPSVSEGSKGNVVLAYNIIDSGDKSALIISENSNYYIYNNVFRSAGQAIKPATIDIRYEVANVFFKNNIIIATEPDGYLLRLGYYTPTTKNYVFDHNCWWQPSGATTKAFYDVEKGSYDFSAFKTYPSVTDTLFVDGMLNSDFSVNNSSPCIDAGLLITTESFLAKDYKGNTAPQGTRDIGAIETVNAIILAPPTTLQIYD